MTTIYECIKNYVPLFCVSIFPFVIPDLIRDPGEILKFMSSTRSVSCLLDQVRDEKIKVSFIFVLYFAFFMKEQKIFPSFFTKKTFIFTISGKKRRV